MQAIPSLDGELLVDEGSRAAIASDWGHIFHRVPAAVLRPRSAQDVVAMVRYANQHALAIATKGDGHSRYGQTQAEGGIVLDSRTLNEVRISAPDFMDAQPGAFWSDVATATLARGLTPRVFPATCLALTVGDLRRAAQRHLQPLSADPVFPRPGPIFGAPDRSVRCAEWLARRPGAGNTMRMTAPDS